MHALQDLQKREGRALKDLGENRILVERLDWPTAIDAGANGQVDEARKNISQYLRLLLTFREMGPRVRTIYDELAEKKAAVQRAEAKLELAWEHRPLHPDEMKQRGRQVPAGYDRDQAIRDWEATTMNDLYEKKEKRTQEVAPAQAAYDAMQAEVKAKVDELRECVQLINELLGDIRAKPAHEITNGAAHDSVPVNDEALDRYWDRRDRNRLLAQKKNGSTGSTPLVPRKAHRKKQPRLRIDFDEAPPTKSAPTNGTGVHVTRVDLGSTEIIVNNTIF